MRRRRVLALVGASAFPFAGCLDRTGSSVTAAPATTSGQPSSVSPTESPSPSPSTLNARTVPVGETYESSTGATVTVREVGVSKLVRSTSVGSSTHIDVACLADHQFAVADIEATDADGTSLLTDAQFVLEVDGVQYPRDGQHWYWTFPPGSYDRPGLPAFPAPITDAANASIIWLRKTDTPVRWKLSAETVGSLGTAPEFAVSSFQTPDSIRRGDVFEASFTVGNTGEGDGRFMTEFGAGPISDHGEVTVDVPAGAERTHTETIDPHSSENTEEIRVTLDWGCHRLNRTISVHN